MTTNEIRLPATRLPIVEVTVLEDRARVRRRGVLTLDTDTASIALTDVATTLVDRTLAGYTLGTDARGQLVRTPLGSLRVERERLHETSALPATIAEVQREIEDARRRLASLESSAREVDAYVASLAAIGKMAIDDKILAAAHGLGDVALWRARLDALDDKARASREERLSLEARIADTQA
ncbi:MAG: hypothetical protein K1X94_33715, partial [Sandaracinaceae bacterium]|nr:hypothetical protein [Sandaracinaceae bacterium]